MKIVASQRPHLTLELTEAEMVLITNALNEVCNGVHIEEPEFAARLGGTLQEARSLLANFSGALSGVA